MGDIPTSRPEAPHLIDRFMPHADVAERHDAIVAAPADLVFEVARELDLLSIPLVAAIFRLREILMGATPQAERRPRGIVDETLLLGWGRLAEEPGREIVMGAVTRPWEPDVIFSAVPPEHFAAFAVPGFVKIAWTLEAESIDGTHARFRTQTRVLATDEAARRKFTRYWRLVGRGIVLIRWVTVRAVRREAERRVAARGGRASRRAVHASTCRASREERTSPMPADGIVAGPMATFTNAITIEAPPAQVWPWLAQMGGGRAGWYSYDHIDNGGRPSASGIVQDLQHLAPGDIVPAIPGATDAFVVAAADPPRDLVLTVPGAGSSSRVSWEYLLRPLSPGCTRLVVRGRVSRDWLAPPSAASTPTAGPILIERVYGLLAKIPRPLMLPVAGLGHRVMVARQLRGIKKRAEASSPRGSTA